MSKILHPIHGVKETCRPKHQVLVLKCYPNNKYVKSQAEVKPNSSELSYLLYYASTRRSKLQKVGAFLEKKTASDVWRVKLGNVQVTLQILTALMEKAPRDLPLYSRFVLSILDTVLRSNDINMIEESTTTFDTFCRHVDFASLAADQNISHQYLSIVQNYASFASPEFLKNPKIARTPPLVFRWRTVSLQAIKSVVGSDAIQADTSKQLEIVMPVILDNLYLEEDDILAILQQKAQTSEKTDLENVRKRRMSIATATTVDTVETDPATASGTTADADKLARDEVRVLAVRCLKEIFAAGTSGQRGQIRRATGLTLRFIAQRNPPSIPDSSFRPTMPGTRNGNWATSLVETVTRWTPVQDRFIIVVTAVETLVRSPIKESVLDKQLILATVIDWLLSSSINLIGLSVMDVLLGFVNHTLLLLQLGGRDSNIAPHHQQSTALDLFHDVKDTLEPGAPFVREESGREKTRTETKPSQVRQELLERLQKCIGDLATHIYYTDQITDMMTAILARLKPSSGTEKASAAAIEDPSATAAAIAAAARLQEDPTTDGFFSFATARRTALKAVRDILVISNLRRTSQGPAAEARSRVGIQVWEGTQWLLRDDDREVRAAYASALLVWLKLETNKNDLHLPKEGSRRNKSVKKQAQDGADISLAKRAFSNASRREPKPAKSTFLQLLHLAIYDNALESPDNEADILTLAVLLASLIERLGVNAVRTGLPMVLRLQEAVLNDDVVRSLPGRVHVASLVHGYLWSIAEKFDFETSNVGNEINAEISRRKRFRVWFDKMRFPPIPIDHIPLSLEDKKHTIFSKDAIGTLRPFLSVSEFVEEVATAYDNSLVTPANSPPSSPGRVFSVPTLGFGYGYGVAPGPRPSPEDQLPPKVKEEMLGGWSRDLCIASVERERTVSVSGSRAGTSGGPRYLQINGQMANGSASGRESPNTPHVDLTGGNHASLGVAGGLAGLQKLRRLSTHDGSPVPLTASSSRNSTMRVNDLKQALVSYPPSARRASPPRQLSKRTGSFRSDGSESIVAYSKLDEDDLSIGPEERPKSVVAGTHSVRSPTASSANRDSSLPRTVDGAGENTNGAKDMSDRRFGEDIPPVPQIPSSFNLPGTYPPEASTEKRPETVGMSHSTAGIEQNGLGQPVQGAIGDEINESEATREGRSLRRGNSRPTSRRGAGNNWDDNTFSTKGKFDVGRLLAGIHPTTDPVSGSEKGKGRSLALQVMSRPPY